MTLFVSVRIRRVRKEDSWNISISGISANLFNRMDIGQHTGCSVMWHVLDQLLEDFGMDRETSSVPKG